MAVPFPPKVVYPLDYDTDRTLFKVYNTSETVLSANLEAWATTINIIPVELEKNEIWSDNGYVTISGELIYYDAVGKDSNGKINTLLNCIRNLGGQPPQYNLAGTDVRGFVLAEHHNQLARAIVNAENFMGINLAQDKATLDWRIRNLANQGAIIDDYGCPEINFNYYIISEDITVGTTIAFNLEVNGTFDSFVIDFGDEQSTTTVTGGTHLYAPNSTIDPVVTVTSTNCEGVVSGVKRNVLNQPLAQQVTIDLNIAVPTIPEFPNLPSVFTNNVNNQLLLPPIVFPCLDPVGFGPITVPSVIKITPPLIIPSIVNFVNPPNIPSSVSISPVSINLPSYIYVEGLCSPIPPTPFPPIPPAPVPPTPVPPTPVPPTPVPPTPVPPTPVPPVPPTPVPPTPVPPTPVPPTPPTPIPPVPPGTPIPPSPVPNPPVSPLAPGTPTAPGAPLAPGSPAAPFSPPPWPPVAPPITPPSPIPPVPPSGGSYSCSRYGYVGGGSTDGVTAFNNIFKVDFTNDAASLVGTATLYQAAQDLHGLSGAFTQGYFSGGASNALATKTNIFDYSSETRSTLDSDDLKRYRGFGISDGAYRGYISGGSTAYSGTSVKSTIRLVFSNNTVSQISSLELPEPTTGLTGSDGATLKGYFAGGYTGALIVRINQISYQNETLSSAPGILSPGRQYTAGCSGTEAKGYLSGGFSSTWSQYTSILIHNTGATVAKASADLGYGIQRAAGLTNRQSRGYFVGGEANGGFGGITLGTLNIIMFSLDASFAALTSLPLGAVRQGMAAISPICRPLGGPGGFVAGGSYGFDGFTSSYSKKTDKIVFAYDTTIAVTSADLKSSPTRREATAGVSGNSYRGYWAGGYADRFTAVIDKIYYSVERTVAVGTAVLTDGTHGACGVSQGDYKGIIAGGYRKTGAVTTDLAFKLTYASPETLSAATSANLNEPRSYMGSISNNLYKGYFAGGINEVVRYQWVQVVAFSSNTSYWLSSKMLTRSVSELAGMDADNTKGYFGGGDTSPYGSSNVVDKFDFSTDTITATTSISKCLSLARTGLGAVSERVSKGYFVGGSSSVLQDVGTCDKITFSTDVTDATLSGNLTQSRTYVAGVSAVVRPTMSSAGAYFTGGYSSSSPTVLTEKIVYQDDISFYLATANLVIRRANAAAISESEYYGYICSGNLSDYGNTSLTNTFEYIDYSNDTRGFITSSVIGQARESMAGCTGNDTFGYFAGGQTTVFSSRIDKFSYETNACNQLTSESLSSGRAFLTAISSGYNRGYFAGGLSSVPVSTVESILFSTDVVSTNSSVMLGGPRWGLSGNDGDSNEGYFAGGIQSGNIVNFVESLSYSSGEISATLSGTLTTPRYNLASATDGQAKGYFSGGASSRNMTSAMSSITEAFIYGTTVPIQGIGTAALTVPRFGLVGMSGSRNLEQAPTCGNLYTNGSSSIHTKVFSYPDSNGLIEFEYNAYNSPDRFIVSDVFNNVFLDTGYVGTTTTGCPSWVQGALGNFPATGNFSFTKPAEVQRIKVTIESPCENIGWDYQLSCLQTNLYTTGLSYGTYQLRRYGESGFYTKLAPAFSAENYNYAIDYVSDLYYGFYLSEEDYPFIFAEDGVWKEISTGTGHFMGTRNVPNGYNNILVVEGDNTYGQLGLGDTVPRNSLTPTNFAATKVACGAFHSMRIDLVDTLYVCGFNNLGQLGKGNTQNYNTWQQLVSGVKFIAAGVFTSFYINSSGQLYGTGANSSGQLGIGPTLSVSQFTQTGTGAGFWASVSAGQDHTFAIKTDGTMWATGKNDQGQLGTNDLTNRSAFTQVGTDINWAKVSCGLTHTMAIKTDGSLWATGDNSQGQFGNSSISSASRFVQVGSFKWKEVYAGNKITMAIRDTGITQPSITVNADYFIIQYNFAQTAGTDLDTSTKLTYPTQEGPYGFSCRNQGTSTYMEWGGDNTGFGVESVLIKIKDIRRDFPNATYIDFLCACHWYGSRYTGDISLDISAYRGGTPQKQGYGFVINNGTLLDTLKFPDNITKRYSSCESAQVTGVIRYDLVNGEIYRLPPNVSSPGILFVAWD